MTAVSGPRVIKLRSGDVVQVRPVRPADTPAPARAAARIPWGFPLPLFRYVVSL